MWYLQVLKHWHFSYAEAGLLVFSHKKVIGIRIAKPTCTYSIRNLFIATTFAAISTLLILQESPKER
jgi:hypothetical protein